jgi:hypothetical protein
MLRGPLFCTGLGQAVIGTISVWSAPHAVPIGLDHCPVDLGTFDWLYCSGFFDP